MEKDHSFEEKRPLQSIAIRSVMMDRATRRLTMSHSVACPAVKAVSEEVVVVVLTKKTACGLSYILRRIED